MPDKIRRILCLLLAGTLTAAAGILLLIVKRKKLSFEVWISLLIFCIVSALALGSVAVCLAAAFSIAK